jgi:hypothetical protein
MTNDRAARIPAHIGVIGRSRAEHATFSASLICLVTHTPEPMRVILTVPGDTSEEKA